MKGAEHGYTYTGDQGSYVVTMLHRDKVNGVAKVRVERVLAGDSDTLVGLTVRVPLRRCVARDSRENVK